MPKFTKGDPRIHKGGRPKKKTFNDVIESIGAVVIKDKDGKELDRLEGNDRLLKEIVDVGIKDRNPTMMKFIYQHMNAPQYDDELLKIKKQVEKARARKIEIENDIKKKRAEMREELERSSAEVKKYKAIQEEIKTKEQTGKYIEFATMRYYFSFFQRGITDSFTAVKKVSKEIKRLYAAGKDKEAERVLLTELHICFTNAIKAMESEIDNRNSD